eukprot:TRINITY_DN39264_c0_g1_i1.p1 TRINITY_DN39264_c0_g1~~TRINITY_DN39264_c0_g1_i1.p1  ORF type:complete len:270 (+),score=65.76 TRINITY_DN39264_c0_g1_i1:52-810(+)
MALRVSAVLRTGYPMGRDLTRKAGEGFKKRKPMAHQNIIEMKPYIERGMPLVYPRWYEDSEERVDHNYVLFNCPHAHNEKIGVVVEVMRKTVVVACRYFVRYKNFAKVVARTQRAWAHDEDCACIVGDVVHIVKGPRRGKFKTYMIRSILEPNVDGRERLRAGMPSMDPAARPTQQWEPIFDLGRGEMQNEEEARRADQMAQDIRATGADYDGSLASRSGRDKWAFLDDDLEMDVDEDEDGDREGQEEVETI